MSCRVPTPATAGSRLRGDEEELFARHHEALRRFVRSQVRVPEADIEEACSYAWLAFVRMQPERQNVWGWLKVTAVRRAQSLRVKGRKGKTFEALAWDECFGNAERISRRGALLTALGRAGLQRRCSGLPLPPEGLGDFQSVSSHRAIPCDRDRKLG